MSAEVLYATHNMQLYCMPDGALQEASFDVVCRLARRDVRRGTDRLVGLSLISVYDVDHAVKELERWTWRGLRGGGLIHGARRTEPRPADSGQPLLGRRGRDGRAARRPTLTHPGPRTLLA